MFRVNFPDLVWKGLAKQNIIVSDFCLSNNELTDRFVGKEAAESYCDFISNVFYPYLSCPV